MTTLTEITELRTEMDAKFERVYGDITELKGELHGVAQDVKELRQEVRQDIKGINAKLDRLETDVAAILVILKQQPPGGQQ